MTRPAPGLLGVSIPYHPPALFLYFSLLNAFLAFGPLGLAAKVLIGLVALLCPFLFFIFNLRPAAQFPEKPMPSAPDPGMIWLVLALGLSLRLCVSLGLPVWPMWDDGIHSLLSYQQSRHWTWHLWYSNEKLGPLSFWAKALWFKLIPPSLFSIWALQALESTLALVAGLWACRQWVSGRLAFLYFCLLALGFWPIYVGQFSGTEACLVFFEFLSLGLWGFIRHLPRGTSRNRLAVVLGLVLGFCGYVSVLALPLIAVVGGGFLLDCARAKPKDWKPALGFSFTLAILMGPVLVSLFPHSSQGHAFQYLWTGQIHSWPAQLKISFSYLTVFLWGTLDKSYFNFGPLWGGYLNPILGGACLVGMVECGRFRNRPAFWGLGAAVLAGLAPGFFSNTVEAMRVLILLPLFLFWTALGLKAVIEHFPVHRRARLLTALLAFSLALDLYHLGGPYHRWAVPDKETGGSKSPEQYRAAQALSAIPGPGLVFSDFYYDVFDESLFLGVFPFNAAANPALDPEKARWAAVLLAPWDVGLFQKEFPQSSLQDLSKGLNPEPDHEVWLAVVPLQGNDRAKLLGWVLPHQKLQDLYGEIPFHEAHPAYGKYLDGLWDLYRGLPPDPFLKECVLEKIVLPIYRTRDLTRAWPLLSLPPGDLAPPPPFQEPLAEILHHLGTQALSQGQPGPAEKIFRLAARVDPRYDLRKSLRLLPGGSRP
ncbi:MAG TPA: hypothetical protein VMU88_05610 [bacterium]|nr:hypothetical protein [bacterium]